MQIGNQDWNSDPLISRITSQAKSTMSLKIKPGLSLSHVENTQDMSACVISHLDAINFMPNLY